MTENVQLACKIAAVAFITTSMLSAGLCVTMDELIGQFRRTRLVAVALLANFVIAPAVAWLLCRLLPIDPGYEAGLILVSGGAGAPMLPKLAERAKANVAFAIAIMILLVLGTVAFMPLVMPRVLPGLHSSPLGIAHPLVTFIVVPLIAGLLVRRRWSSIALRAEPALRRLSDICLLVFVVVVVATHLDALWGALGSGAILAALLFVLLSGSAAYGLGGDLGTRRVLALATGQRNIAAALVTAGLSFTDQPKVFVMILVTDVVAIVILLVAVRRMSRKDSGGAGVPGAEFTEA